MVCLLMANRPEYMAIWLGITSVGVVVVAAQYESGRSVAGPLHLTPCRRSASSWLRNCVDALTAALPDIDEDRPRVWVHGPEMLAEFRRIDLEVMRYTPASR